MIKLMLSHLPSLLVGLLLTVSNSAFSQKNINLQANWNGSLYEYNDVWGYADFSGKEYAIIGSKKAVHFIEVTEPTSPKLIAEFEPGSSTNWRDIKTFNHYAYAVSEGFSNEGLVIFDLCAIAEGEVNLLSQNNDVFGKAHNIFIDPKHKLLYVLGADTKQNGYIVYDLSDPANPSLIAKKSLPGGYVHDIFVKDNLAFCSHGYNGLYIYDVTNPENPVPKAFANTGAYNHSSWVMDDNLLLFAQEIPTGLPLGIMDYANYLSNDLEVINSFSAPLLGPTHKNTAHNPYMVGDYAVVSYYEDGVVIFDMANPMQPDTVAYYDTYANNEYSGTKGCWGVYPFLPSGNILASDITNGLFVLKPTFDLPSLCNNGKSDWNEENIDCGGICQLCTPCVQEICGNNIDDDRNGKTDCEDVACACEGSQTKINLKVYLEGFYNESSTQMTRTLIINDLLPLYQPFKTTPFYYAGRESISDIPVNAVDWVLLEARHVEKLDSVLARKAALLLNDGTIVEADGSTGIRFDGLSANAIHLVIRHKGHLAIMSSSLLDLSKEEVTYDFTQSATKAMGTNQLKLKGNYYCQFAGDFDQNGIINSLDFNIWKQNSALINRYLHWDVDGNGVVNNLDFNYWKGNRSKIGEPMVHLDSTF